MIKPSFIIPCKGRLEHLKLTLATKICQTFKGWYEVIVVDYTCPDNTAKWVQELKNPRVRAIVVPADEYYFNNSHCRNCGAESARGNVLCFSDADCFVAPEWLEYIDKHWTQSTIGFGNGFKPGDDQLGRGTWAVRKSVWKDLRGYNEQMECWGFEELDFLMRMKRHGVVKPFPLNMCWTIKHGDEERLKYYTIKEKNVSNMCNMRVAKYPGQVNPTGFGELTRNIESII